VRKLIVGLAKGTLKYALRDFDPNVEGGVPVLGANGISIIGHGSSTPTGIKNMILRGVEVARAQLHKHIENALSIAVPPEQNLAVSAEPQKGVN
jgi:glycerol-3-phosphate acyltransferase PlsX